MIWSRTEVLFRERCKILCKFLKLLKKICILNDLLLLSISPSTRTWPTIMNAVSTLQIHFILVAWYVLLWFPYSSIVKKYCSNHKLKLISNVVTNGNVTTSCRWIMLHWSYNIRLFLATKLHVLNLENPFPVFN